MDATLARPTGLRLDYGQRLYDFAVFFFSLFSFNNSRPMDRKDIRNLVNRIHALGLCEMGLVFTYIFWDSSSGKLRDLTSSPGWKNKFHKSRKKSNSSGLPENGKFHHFTTSMGQPRQLR